MAEQTNDQVQGVKTMLKGKPSSDAGASVKDQVKAALLKNKAKTQEPASGTPSVDNYANNANIPSRSQNQGGTNSSPNMTSPQAADPVISKIERTVDSINEVHSTMESLNKNMNMFVDLFNRRGGSLASDGGNSIPQSGNAGVGGMSSGLGVNAGNATPDGGMMQGQNAVTTLLLTNLLKKKDSETEDKLGNLEKGSKEYLDLLIKKLDKFQHEYELLQYLFEPKMLGNAMEPTNDAQGNSAWLAGFMSMMVNRKG